MAKERPRQDHEWADKLDEWRERYERKPFVFRVLYLTTGLILFLGGLAMLVLPGPALLVIPIGLAMLAMQFAWADWALGVALRQASRAQQKAAEASRGQKIFGALATVLGVAAAITAWLVWEIPLIPG